VKRSEAAVPRETLAALAQRYALPAGAVGAFERLLSALAAEPDPPTTVRDPIAAAEVHVADSLAGLEVPDLRDAARIADLGAGAGFPGLVLAAALPGSAVDLIESARRKVAVIERLAEAAGVEVRAVPVRAEDWAAGEGAGAYGAVSARALAPLAVLVEYAAPLLEPGGVLVAWKGARDADEESAGAEAARLLGLKPRAVVPVTPYPASENRHLHVYSKVGPTPGRFPRRAGMASKRPLGARKSRTSTST
jgi:16S rRNA (guanine527-N7)-methyltransferase